MDEQTTAAIRKTQEGNWSEAAKINIQIVKKNPLDSGAFNRLAKAYIELGKIKEAQATYRKVLKLDPHNPIAQRNLERLKNVRPEGNKPSPVSPQVAFIEEPGRTKTVALVKIGSPQKLSRLDPGDEVILIPRQHSVSVILPDQSTVGRLPDDLAARLLPMIKSGNLYKSFIRSATPSSVKIFIHEEKRSKKYSNTASFVLSDSASYVAYIPPELVHEGLSTRAEEETTEDS